MSGQQSVARPQPAPEDQAPAEEVALLRSLALAASEAAAAGEHLPPTLSAPLNAWLNAGWLESLPPTADQSFAQGYLAGMELAARQCEAAAAAQMAARRQSWNPLRRRRLRRLEDTLRAMAGSLRLMAGGVRHLHG